MKRTHTKEVKIYLKDSHRHFDQREDSRIATLPRFDDTDYYDSYYNQEYYNGNAHPFSGTLLVFLSIL